jgi:hypothetical protein
LARPARSQPGEERGIVRATAAGDGVARRPVGGVGRLEPLVERRRIPLGHQGLNANGAVGPLGSPGMGLEDARSRLLGHLGQAPGRRQEQPGAWGGRQG